MEKTYCLEVIGDFACFTRPEMKVERVSYDVITPSAARSIFEAILWKPAIAWRITKIEVLNPIRWINLRRNEVGAVASTRGGALFIEDERQQRAGLFLRDVAYRIHAHFELRDPTFHKANFPHLSPSRPDPGDTEGENLFSNPPAKFLAMFERRAARGQCVNQPYLGCREFACNFRLVENPAVGRPAIQETRDLGWMLHDLDYADPADPKPRFFRAELNNGVIDLAHVEVRG